MQVAHERGFMDPKLVFTLDIVIPSVRNIITFINSGWPKSASDEMDILLAQLDIPQSEKELITIRESYEKGTIKPGMEEQRRIFRKLADFLNRTYYKDFKGYSGIDPDKEYDKE